ncbi:MAG: M1 family metallopeptidase [Candidatus Hodarchaeales archaeon]
MNINKDLKTLIKSKYVLSSIIIVFITLTLLNSNYLNQNSEKPFLNDKNDIFEVKEKNANSRFQPCPDINASREYSNYTMDLTFYPDQHRILGNLTFSFLNYYYEGLNRLYFHLYANASVNESSPGYSIIKSVKPSSTSNIELNFTVTDQLLNVSLPESLCYHERTSVWIQFETQITDSTYFRLNYNQEPNMGKVTSISNFYPILAVWDISDGWNLEPLLDIGDPYYSESAHYNVSIQVPQTELIASSGELQEFKVISPGWHLRRFISSSPIRDFALTSSPDYLTESSLFDGINISIFYLPNYTSSFVTQSIEYAKNALEIFSDIYGPYPWSTLTISDYYGRFGGMEWPTHIWIQPTSNLQSREQFIVHEIAHQWWYAAIGNDEIDEGFIDEGMAVFSEWMYYRSVDVDLYINKLKSDINYAQLLDRFPDDQGHGWIINRSINEIVSEHMPPVVYLDTAYTKMPAVLYLLKSYIGEEKFFNALKRCYNNYLYEIVSFNDFLSCFNSQVDITWFYPWFNEPKLPKIQIDQVKAWPLDSEGYQFEIKLKQYNSDNLNPYPTLVPILINYNDNSILRMKFWCNNTDVITYGFVSYKNAKPISLEINQSLSLIFPEYPPVNVTIEIIPSSSSSITSTTKSSSFTSSTSFTTFISTSETSVDTYGFTYQIFLLIGFLLVIFKRRKREFN